MRYLEDKQKRFFTYWGIWKWGEYQICQKKMNQDNLSQRVCYRFPKQDMVHQLEKVFVFDLETYN